jgi:hypothetical protein
VETCNVDVCAPGTAVVCEDSVGCTVDGCNEVLDACEYVPDHAVCQNGVFCDGVEVCDPVLDCQAGTAVDCTDSVGCTDDSCNETTDSCDNIPNDGLCDNGLYCDGLEVCHWVLGCYTKTISCGPVRCDEDNDVCMGEVPALTTKGTALLVGLLAGSVFWLTRRRASGV